MSAFKETIFGLKDGDVVNVVLLRDDPRRHDWVSVYEGPVTVRVVDLPKFRRRPAGHKSISVIGPIPWAEYTTEHDLEGDFLVAEDYMLRLKS